MQEAKAPSFFKYFDTNTGKLRKDAPTSAKKAFKAWQNEPRDGYVKKSVKRTKRK